MLIKRSLTNVDPADQSDLELTISDDQFGYCNNNNTTIIVAIDEDNNINSNEQPGNIILNNNNNTNPFCD